MTRRQWLALGMVPLVAKVKPVESIVVADSWADVTETDIQLQRILIECRIEREILVRALGKFDE